MVDKWVVLVDPSTYVDKKWFEYLFIKSVGPSRCKDKKWLAYL